MESFHGLRYHQTAALRLPVRAHAQAPHRDKPVQGDNDAWRTGFLMLVFPSKLGVSESSRT